MKKPSLCLFMLFLCLFMGSASEQALSSESAVDVEDRVQRVVNGLIPFPGILIKGQTRRTASLTERMKYYRLPGLSLAVIDSYDLEWAEGYGMTEMGGSDPVDLETLFQAASISQPVAAAAALSYVESGLLNLDEDVNGWLRSWKVPENQWTRKSKVTLRGLLSHTAGITVDRFPGYADGVEIPSLRQVLDGAKPANTAAIKVDSAVGTKFRYSGGGYTILQQLLIDVLNRPFPEIMRGAVLAKLGMENSTYEQPLPESLRDQAASGHRLDGTVVPGKWHTYPEMAAAGLWTTASDLARFAVAVSLAKQGKSERILSKAMTELMLTARQGNVGLGLFLRETGEDIQFYHSGENEGFSCGLVAFPERGQGAVIMTNGGLGAELISEILRSLALEYGWPDYKPVEKEAAAYDAQNLKAVAGTYRFGPKDTIKVSFEQGRLFAEPVYVHPNRTGKCEFYPESRTAFFSTETDVMLIFSKSQQGRVTGLTLRRGRSQRKAVKVK